MAKITDVQTAYYRIPLQKSWKMRCTAYAYTHFEVLSSRSLLMMDVKGSQLRMYWWLRWRIDHRQTIDKELKAILLGKIQHVWEALWDQMNAQSTMLPEAV